MSMARAREERDKCITDSRIKTVLNRTVYRGVLGIGITAHRKHEPIQRKWRVTHQSYTPFDSVLLCLYLSALLDFIE